MQQDDHRQAARVRLERTESYLASDPENTHLLLAAIDEAMAAGLVERAAAHAETAIARFPENDVLLARFGNTLLARRRYAEAATLFDGLTARHRDAGLAYGAAYARYAQGAHAEALACLLPHADDTDLAPQVAVLLVRLLHLAGDPEAALAYALRRQKDGGGDIDLLAASSLAALDANDVEAAQSLSGLALAGAARPAEALVTAGSLALGRMDVDTAERLLNEVLSTRPEEGRAWSALGMASLLRNDIAAARVHLEKALSLMPAHIGTWHSYGWTSIFARNLGQARSAFDKALALDRNFGESHGGLAVVLALSGERELALQSIDRALKLDPQGMSARYAEMVLAGDTADPERFKQVAIRLMRGRKGVFGNDMAGLIDGVGARK